MTLPDPSFVIAGVTLLSSNAYAARATAQDLPEAGSPIQAFGVAQQDLVRRDTIRFDGKGFVVVEGVPATFEENAAAAGNNAAGL